MRSCWATSQGPCSHPAGHNRRTSWHCVLRACHQLHIQIAGAAVSRCQAQHLSRSIHTVLGPAQPTMTLLHMGLMQSLQCVIWQCLACAIDQVARFPLPATSAAPVREGAAAVVAASDTRACADLSSKFSASGVSAPSAVSCWRKPSTWAAVATSWGRVRCTHTATGHQHTAGNARPAACMCCPADEKSSELYGTRRKCGCLTCTGSPGTEPDPVGA